MSQYCYYRHKLLLLLWLLVLVTGFSYNFNNENNNFINNNIIMSGNMHVNEAIQKIQEIVGSDIGNRGMDALVVPDDLIKAARTFCDVGTKAKDGCILILSGFPCCVNESPPTETDGPPGAFAIARAAAAICDQSCKVIIVTDESSKEVFQAALQDLALPQDCNEKVSVKCFSISPTPQEIQEFEQLKSNCHLIIACERAGDGQDGNCYTMRGINMTDKKLISSIVNQLVTDTRINKDDQAQTTKVPIPFIGIGDGGNELGMGKVLDKILASPKIQQASKIASVVPADYLIAASISNWGGYALAGSVALVRAEQQIQTDKNNSDNTSDQLDVKKFWMDRCLPNRNDEIALLDRCVAVGCRDGVSGKVEPTVDGFPLETSLKCLDDIRNQVVQ